jgi:hypothetical protein
VVVATLTPPPQRLGVTHWSSRLLAAELGVGLRQLHYDAGHDPAVAEPDRFRALRRTVVMPRHTEHLLARPREQRVVDRDRERGSRREQPGHDQIGQGQAERITRPAGDGE